LHSGGSGGQPQQRGSIGCPSVRLLLPYHTFAAGRKIMDKSSSNAGRKIKKKPPSKKEKLRDELIERLKCNPNHYLNISKANQKDPKICLATLLSFNNRGYYDDDDDDYHAYHENKLPEILDMIMDRMPKFADHKPALLRFLQRANDRDFVGKYMHRFRTEIEGDRDFLKEALQHDCLAIFFQQLSPALRMDLELLKLAMESVMDHLLPTLLRAFPSEALVEHPCILLLALDRGTCTDHLRPEEIPPPFWQNRDFILKWTKRRNLYISTIPREFSNDREICLSLYRNQWSHSNFDEIVGWIEKPLLADKSFVLDCLELNTRVYRFCEKELQDDFDVLLAAAFRAIQVRSLRFFMESMGESVVSRVKAIRDRFAAHNEFMTFLVCSWKGSKLLPLSLSTLECDDETARGLKTMIARYLAFPGTKCFERLKTVWDALVQLTVEGGNISNKLIPLIPRQTLVHSALKVIECGRSVSLQSYPDELWGYRVFVKWAAKKGIFSKSMPDEFSRDPEICLLYYQNSVMFRESSLPWISESLKSDRDFVLQCARVHPAIINHCKSHDLLYDFEVLFAAVRRVVATDRMGIMAHDALKYGYGDALIFFAKAVRAKAEAQLALGVFGDQVGAHYFGDKHAVKSLIGSYLGIHPSASERDELQTVWSNRAIFCLALGGNIEELSKTYPLATHQEYRYWPNKRKWMEIEEEHYEENYVDLSSCEDEDY
jgi:hypothetical protein